MTWPEWLAARQLLTEESLGAPTRQAKAAEDDEFSRTAGALRRQ